MTDIWVYLIWNVVLAALLALAVASVGCLKLIRSRPALRHALWLLVLIKLITPPLIPLPVLPGGHAKPEVAAAATVNAPTEHTRDDVGQPSVSNARPEASNPANHSTGQPFSTHTARPASSESRQPASSGRWDAFSANDLVRVGWLPWLCGLWAVGTIVLSVRTACQTLNVLRLIRRSGNDTGRLAALARDAAQQMRVDRSPQVRIVNGRVTPFLWVRRGNPVIVLPKTVVEQLSDDQILCIICHELAHYIRWDHWSNMFAYVVAALFWWHPVAWWARREVRSAQELCCDSLVISGSANGPRHYAETLLQVIDLTQLERSRLPQIASGFGQCSSIKRRFEMIASGNLDHRLSWPAYALIAAVVVSLPCFPVAAQTDHQPANAAPDDDKEQLRHKQKGPRKAAAKAIDTIAGKRAAPRKQGTENSAKESASALRPRPAVDTQVDSQTKQPDQATTSPNPPPSKSSKAETITVQGVILDPEKRPLANVDVRIYESFTYSEKLFGKVRSGKDGGFRFEGIPMQRPGRWYFNLTASSPNFATRLLGSAPASKKPMRDYGEVVLFEPESLRGRVVGPDGEPVAGAVVYTPPFQEPTPGMRTATTDANGHFEIRDLMEWDSTKEAPWSSTPGGGSKSLRIFHPKFGKILASYKRVPSTVSVKFSRPTIITGRVVDRETGKPATEVPVIGGYVLTKTGQDGRYRLVVQRDTKDNRDITIKSMKKNGDEGQSISLTAIPGARIELPDFHLSQ